MNTAHNEKRRSVFSKRRCTTLTVLALVTRRLHRRVVTIILYRPLNIANIFIDSFFIDDGNTNINLNPITHVNPYRHLACLMQNIER